MGKSTRFGNVALVLSFIAACWMLLLAVDGDGIELDGPANQFRAGHLKPFGTAGAAHLAAEIVDGFPSPEVFHRKYVVNFKLLLMRGAVTNFPARSKWTDERLLALDLTGVHDSVVLVETKKKENREEETLNMHFQQFLKEYNKSELYVVARVPSFMAKDMPLPWPLQCDGLRNAFVDCLMWFSSGGTSSVVHTDEVDNLNCVLAGNKTFVVVDPTRHGDKVPIDKPNGAYSTIDVDAVDYLRYKNIHAVEFYHVHLQAGDCLYIPFKWIHQVRSYGRNIAVNIWWDRSQVDAALGEPSAVPRGCPSTPQSQSSVASLQLQGLSGAGLRTQLRQILVEHHEGLPVDAFLKSLVPVRNLLF